MEQTSEPKEWFPMRVTYARELSAKAELDRLGVECFVPLRREVVTIGGKRLYKTLAAIHNLVFVRGTKEQITSLKHTRKELMALRYIMKEEHFGLPGVSKTVLTVPDRQMENFMRVAAIDDDRVIFLEQPGCQPQGRKVRIVDGEFTGVEGVIRRIQKNRRVVVELEGLAAVAIAFVPPSCLIYVD